MAMQLSSRSLLSKTLISSLLSRSLSSCPLPPSPRPLSLLRTALHPLSSAIASTANTSAVSRSSTAHSFSTRATSSSLNDPSPNWSNRPPNETILLDGWDFEHWLVARGDNTFDDGTKKAWLDNITGGFCLSISSKGLAITEINDRRYWNHIPAEESRFSSVAYLQQIWWFEVDGEFEFPFLAGTYSILFRLQLGRTTKRYGRRICNTEHVHGWDIKSVRF